MTVNKKHPMTMTMAAKLLADEHPEFAFSAVQLQRMASKRVIPSLEIPACGLKRKYYRMVNYPALVKHLQGCYKTAIYLPDNA